jgi:hypothetical protein
MKKLTVFIVFLTIFVFKEAKPGFPFGFASDEGPYFSVGFSDPQYEKDDNNPDFFYTYGRYNTPYYKPRYNNLPMYEYDSQKDEYN